MSSQRTAEPSSAEKVADILMSFSRGGRVRDRMGVSEIARTVGRERSQVSRMLKALAKTNLVQQNQDDRTYRLGWQLQVLAAGAGNQSLLRASRPVLQGLVARTGETALVSIQQGNRSLTVLREDSQRSLQAGGWVGRSSPLHCTASGRALMFDAEDGLLEILVEDSLSLPATGPRAPKSLAELLARIGRERERGFTVASEEVEVGLTSVSAPIRDGAGQIMAVVNSSGPSSRMSDRIEEIARLTVASSAAIAKALRHPAAARA